MRQILISVLCALCFPLTVIAAPSISSTSGTWAHDQSVVISGSGFASKGTAAPIKFEDFEDGENAALISTTSYWSILSDNAEEDQPQFSNASNRTNSTLSALAYLWGANDYFYKTGLGLGTKFFISFWYKYDRNENTADTCQIKVWGIYNSGGSPALSYFNTYYTATGEWERIQLTRADGAECGTGDANYFGISENEEWTHHQIQIDVGTAGNSDGVIKVWVNGTLEVDQSSYNITATGAGDCTFDAVKFGRWLDNEGVNPVSNYFDDIYVDTGWSRVEIGNNSAYANCTHREMQLPTAWADGEITITVNAGSIANFGTYYLYVIDSDGTVSDAYGPLSSPGGGSENVTGVTIGGCTVN